MGRPAGAMEGMTAVTASAGKILEIVANLAGKRILINSETQENGLMSPTLKPSFTIS